jgi:hypothetical protein
MKMLALKPYFHFGQVRQNVPTRLSPEQIEKVKSVDTMCVHHRAKELERARQDMSRRVKSESSHFPIQQNARLLLS